MWSEAHLTTENKSISVRSGFMLVTTSHTLNHTYNSLLPILYPSMISEFQLSYSLVGMLVMGYRLSGGALQLLMGFLGRFVRRKMLLGFGMIWQSVANSFIAASQSFEHVLVNRVLAGVGSSPQHPTGTSYIAENFPQRQIGKALGANIVAAQFGSFITPFIGSLLLSRLGWRTTILAFSIPGLAVGLAFMFIAEPRRSREWSGLSSLTMLSKGVRQVLKDRIVLTVMAVEMVMAFREGARDFIPSYLVRDLGMAPLEVGVLFAVFLGSGLPAPYFWGYLSDRIERRKVVMFAMAVASLLWYSLQHSKDSYQLLLILVPLGFACQGVGGVIQAFVAERTTPENRDLIYGVYFTLAFTLGSLSPVVLGYLADTFGFQVSFSYVAVVSLFSVVVAYLLK